MDLTEVLSEIDETLEGKSLPKRIRDSLTKVKVELESGDADIAVNITSAIYELDDISNDVNITMHTKTLLWDIISNLESLK